jgi:uncharacterized lipoprotein YajG
MKRITAKLLCISCGICVIAGCNKPAETNGPSAPLTAEQQAQMTEAKRKAEIQMRTEQIKGSNLSPEEKQRLLEQVQSSAGR